MANRAEHELIGMAVGAAVSLIRDEDTSTLAVNPATGATLGKYAARLPDILEPAFHPNHRAFFHSWSVLALVGFGTYKAYQWQPEDTGAKILKWALVIGGAAYASHLLRDAITPKGLPTL